VLSNAANLSELRRMVELIVSQAGKSGDGLEGPLQRLSPWPVPIAIPMAEAALGVRTPVLKAADWRQESMSRTGPSHDRRRR
jgi:hypothetical protein